jgi:MftR C-terminal domain
MTQLLAHRLGVPPDDLEVRTIAAAVVAALFVAIEKWQAHDGQGDLRALTPGRSTPSWPAPSRPPPPPSDVPSAAPR